MNEKSVGEISESDIEEFRKSLEEEMFKTLSQHKRVPRNPAVELFGPFGFKMFRDGFIKVLREKESEINDADKANACSILGVNTFSEVIEKYENLGKMLDQETMASNQSEKQEEH